jgi:hypothetical protein
VLKLVPSDSYEVPIIPDPMDVDKTHKAFKLTKVQNDIVEKIMDIEILKDNKETEELNSRQPRIKTDTSRMWLKTSARKTTSLEGLRRLSSRNWRDLWTTIWVILFNQNECL